MDRVQLLARLAALAAARAPAVVAVDGPDAAGKTTLAAGLAERLRADGVPVAQLCGDGFLRPAAERYARGRLSPEGCYRDSFDVPALRASARRPVEGVLLVDGVFLLRPELRDAWDLAVFVDAAPAETVRRALRRDAGEPAEVERRYRLRYLPAHQLYRREARPLARADVVLANDEPAWPLVHRWPS